MIKDFLTKEYLFSAEAPANQQLFLITVGIFLFFIVISIFLSYSKKIHKGLKNRLFNFLLTTGLLGLMISFLRFESVAYIGTRFVMIIFLSISIIWYFSVTSYSIFKMPKEINLIKNHQRYTQYLPKKKSGKKSKLIK
jgi:uncharacterized membrane protein YdcZ (DUF606 family)